MKFFRTFSRLLPLDLFSSQINSLTKEKLARLSSERTQLIQVIESYKQSPEHYNSDLASIVKLFCFSKDVNLKEIFVEDLENEIYKRHDKVPSEELVQFTLCCNPSFKTDLLKHISENSKNFSNEQLTTVASYAYKDHMLVELQKNKKFKVKDLEVCKKVALLTSNPIVLLELSRQLRGMIENEKDLQSFLEILIQIEQKDTHLAENLVEYLEQKLLSSNLKLDFTAIKLSLRLLKSKGLHLSFSTNFYKYFISAITHEITRPKNMRSSFYLSLFGKEQFNIDSIFQILISKFKTEALTYKEYCDALSGFEGCSVSVFFDLELIDLFHLFISKNIQKMYPNELIRVLKIFINQGLYYEHMIDLVLDQLLSRDLSKISANDQIFLEDNCELILIDFPEAQEKLESIKKCLRPRRHVRDFEISNTQHYVSQVLRSLNILFTENQILQNVYEVDFLIPETHIVIEAIGTLYHFNLFSKQLTPKTMVKLRHLSKLGYKIILTIGKESTENHLKKAMFFLNNFKNHKAVLLLVDEIKVIDINQTIRKN